MKMRSMLRVSVAANALLLVAAPAWSQDAAAADAMQNSEIVVTGSRLGRQGFDAPTPTKVLSSEFLQQRGSTNVGEFLNEIPAFRPSQTNQTNPQTSTSAGQFYADLRSLGNIRTLTLVDGRRHVPSAATGQVDLNLIPTILVDRIEVVTGGASAAYGSDAISGVVNLILNKKLQGLKGDFSTAISQYGDNWERRFSLGYGTSFAEDRGHVVIGGDYVKSSGVKSYLERDWGRRADELITFPTTRTAGQPSRMYASGVTYVTTFGGMILGSSTTAAAPTALATTSPLRGIAFGPNNTTYSFGYGNDVYNTGNAYDNTNPLGAFPRAGHQLILPLDRQVGMAHVDYDIADAVSVFAEGSYAKSQSEFNDPITRDTSQTAIVIQRDNAFLPTTVRNLMVANGIQSISVGRFNKDFDSAYSRNSNTTKRLVGGLNGKIGDNWSWDAYYQYGRNHYAYRIYNLRIEQNFRYAYDAILVNGVATCRALVPGSTTYNPTAAAGCQPINIFGDGTPLTTPAGVNYVNGTGTQDIVSTQNVAAANLRGNLFDTWAGPVSVAFGGEYRRDKSVSTVDALSQAAAYNFGNPKNFSGRFSVKEGYVEAAVPLAKDMAFAKSLDLNGAVRYTDYSSSGTVTTWKAGATYEPVDGVKLRGVLSRDIRAPNAAELFSVSSTNSTLRNPFSGASRSYVTTTLASSTLKPEIAKTKSGGVVLTPKFVPGLSMSADYYDIRVKGAIASYGAQAILDNCYAERVGGNNSGPFCASTSLTTASGTSAATEINAVFVQLVNLASIKTSGIDFDMSYRTRLGAGSLTARFFGTYVQHLITNDGLGVARTYNAANVLQTKGSIIDRAGQVGGFTSGSNTGATNAPRWTMNGSLTFADDLFSTTIEGRYVGGGKVDKTLLDPSESDYNALSPISITNNDVKGRFYLNLSASVNVINDGNKKLQLYTVVNNATNIDPPFPSISVSGLYDRLGRYFRVGLRFTY